jgi:hypothetical protein
MSMLGVQPESTDSRLIASLPNPLAAFQRARESKELISWVSQRYEEARRERQKIERQWYMNLAFYFGQQNVTGMSTATGGYQLRVPNAPLWRVRMVVNKIRPIIRAETARLVSQKPTFTVIPATTEDEDQAAARVGEQIFKATYNDKEVDYVLHQSAFWASICGSGFMKSYWDSSIVTDEGAQGDIVIENVNPFHIFPANQAEEDMQKQPYIIQASTKSAEWVKSRFGFDAPANVLASNVLEDAFQNLVGTRTTPKKEVLVIEVWLRPGAHVMFPEGGLLTIVGGQLVQRVDTFPYKHGELPFYKIDVVPTGRFFGESNITDIIPLQREYNRTVSQIIEAKNLMAKPKLMAPRGSINPRAISSEPGQVILYTPGFDRPSELPMPPLPSYVLDQLDRITADIDDISGQHEISRGGAPSQVTAATAISFLQEQDDSKLAYAITSIERSIQRMGRHVLKYVEQYWDVARTVKVVGTDGAFEANQWLSSSLKGNTDLRVEAGSALPQSKAARQAFVMDLLKLGIIPPESGLDMLDIGGIDKIYEDYLVDKRQAERENLKMASINPQVAIQLIQDAGTMTQPDPVTGEPMPMEPQPILPINTWDNHEAHIENHNRFRKSQQFEMMPAVIQQIFEDHVNQHQQALLAGMTPTAGADVGADGTIPQEQDAEGVPQDNAQPDPQQPPA